VGGGVLAIDVFEDEERGFLVNEINHTMEFHTLAPVTGVDIAGLIVDYTIDLAKNGIQQTLPAVGLLDAIPLTLTINGSC
jgi:[lysine-biosynthesis-protein LysW]--L-2-aminoadipate ligase